MFIRESLKRKVSVNVTNTHCKKKCPYSELFWSAFSRIRTEYRKMRTRATPNTDTFYPVTVLNKIKKQCQANVAAIALSTINNRVNPVKHLRWSYWLKYLTVFNHLLFLKRASSQVFDRVLSTPLTPYFLFVRWGTEILKFIILKNTCWWRLSKRDFSTTVAD